MRVVATSGYFNPLHQGHVELFRRARELGDYLIVIVNSDEQVKLKGSKPFMDETERMRIVEAIRYVDHVVLSIDEDKTVSRTLKMIRPHIFVKGGDSTVENVPEQDVCNKSGIEIVLGLGDKIQSSSKLLKACEGT